MSSEQSVEPGGGALGAPTAGTALLEVIGLSKAFSGAPALRSVDLTIRAGEIHGLLGANGSGKSTLIKILAGFHQPDDGRIIVNGDERPMPLGPRGLRDHGVAFVHQDLGLIPASTVLEHMALDSHGAAPGLRRISWRDERLRVEELLARFQVSIDPDALIEILSPVQRAMVAVVRAVGDQERAIGNARSLLVLDEPTVFLPRDEIDLLFALLRRLKSQGNSVVLVSHDLDEVLAVTDRVTVLRDGSLAGTRDVAGQTRQDIVELILGAPDEHVPHGKPTVRTDLPPLMAAEGLTGDRIQNLSIELRGGEVVGVTGLAGSGFEELPELLFGARTRRAGTILVDGREVTRPTPREMLDRRITLVPSDRKAEGAAQDLTVNENLALPFFGDHSGGWLIRWSALREQAQRICRRFNVVPPSVELTFSNLSGGNQQKALLGKWFQTDPLVMLLNEPTQGVDVGARREIFKLIREAVTDGMSALCATSDYEQLVELADRVLILQDGQVRHELHGAEITKDSLAALIYSEAAA